MNLPQLHRIGLPAYHVSSIHVCESGLFECGVGSGEHHVDCQVIYYGVNVLCQGDVVSDGEIIGKVTGLDGLELAKIVAPVEGVVHTMYPRRVVYPGDRLYTLLKIGGLTGY